MHFYSRIYDQTQLLNFPYTSSSVMFVHVLFLHFPPFLTFLFSYAFPSLPHHTQLLDSMCLPSPCVASRSYWFSTFHLSLFLLQSDSWAGSPCLVYYLFQLSSECVADSDLLGALVKWTLEDVIYFTLWISLSFHLNFFLYICLLLLVICRSPAALISSE